MTNQNLCDKSMLWSLSVELDEDMDTKTERSG